MDDLYRDYILEHYHRPHNFGVWRLPPVSYEGNNPLCGDRLTMMLGIEDGVVKEVAFTGRGCAISRPARPCSPTRSAGKTVEEVEKMTPEDVLELLGVEISPARLKCALLSSTPWLTPWPRGRAGRPLAGWCPVSWTAAAGGPDPAGADGAGPQDLIPAAALR